MMQAEIKELKTQLPAAAEDGTRAASPAGTRIAELEVLRKELTKDGNLKDKHHNWGSALLGLGVMFSIAGPLNTYLRTGAASHVHTSSKFGLGPDVLSSSRRSEGELPVRMIDCPFTFSMPTHPLPPLS